MKEGKPKYFKIGDPCPNCKKPVMCRCFEWEIEGENDEGEFINGVMYFCSKKCFRKYTNKNGMGDESEGSLHGFDCEQLGKLKPEYIQMLQLKIKQLESDSMRREHFWHKRVKEVCDHKDVSGSENNSFYCHDCGNYLTKEELKYQPKYKSFDERLKAKLKQKKVKNG